MGVEYIFDKKDEVYKLVDKKYDPIDLLCVGYGLFLYLESINKKGYVSDIALQHKFMHGLSSHLFKLGNEHKIMGNN